MKIKVGSVKAFVEELKKNKISKVRVATLCKDAVSKVKGHQIPTKVSTTVITAPLDINTILVYERSNGTVFFLDELKEVSRKSEESLFEELKKSGFSAKEGMFEL